jgi:hypothetical protein
MSATITSSGLSEMAVGLDTNAYAGTASGCSAISAGTGSNIGSGYSILDGRLLAPSAATAGYAGRGFTVQRPTNAANAGYNYGLPSGHTVRVWSSHWQAAVTGVTMRATFGRAGGSIPSPSTLAERGYGWEWNWGTKVMNIIAHDGSTLTTTPVTWVPIGGRNYEITAISDGQGTVSLYVDGVLLGTGTGAPNILVANMSSVWWQLEIQNLVTASGQVDCNFQNPKVFTTNG